MGGGGGLVKQFIDVVNSYELTGTNICGILSDDRGGNNIFE